MGTEALVSDCTLDVEVIHQVVAANTSFQQLKTGQHLVPLGFDPVCQKAILSMHCHVSFAVLWRIMGCCEGHMDCLAVTTDKGRRVYMGW